MSASGRAEPGGKSNRAGGALSPAIARTVRVFVEGEILRGFSGVEGGGRGYRRHRLGIGGRGGTAARVFRSAGKAEPGGETNHAGGAFLPSILRTVRVFVEGERD